jgi:hypothetical protein
MIRKEQLLCIDSFDSRLHVLECQRSEKIDRIVLTAPLVGGSSRQQVLILKSLLDSEKNTRLYSFDYSGHRVSPDDIYFSITDAIIETKEMIRYAIGISQELGVPLHLVGTCFGTISILLALEELQWPEEITSFTSAFGLVGMNSIIKPEEFIPFLHKYDVSLKTLHDIDKYLTDHPLERQDDLFEFFIPAVCDYLVSIFPELSPVITHMHFGELVYRKTKIAQTFREFLSFGDIVINPPESFQVSFCYGTQDQQMGTHTAEGEKEYCEKVRRLFPYAEIKGFYVNHYNEGPETVESSKNLYETILSAEKKTDRAAKQDYDLSMVPY